MFVPRALRLKGVHEPGIATARPLAASRKDEQHVSAQPNVNEHIISNARIEAAKQPSHDSRFTTKPVPPEYLDELRAGMELIFSDYAHQDSTGAAWLAKHYRKVGGTEKYIHLSAVLEHPNISSLKPVATHMLLQQALREKPSRYLELADNLFFVRRRPSSYPLPFVPNNSFDVVDDEGLSFWDQRTIYVEPHLRALCKTPAKVAYWLQEHGHIKEKWLPIQAVHHIYNSCAFVVLSGNVTHEKTWQKWRNLEKPEFWKVMTKVEHTKRTSEYLEVLAKEKSNIQRQANDGSIHANANQGNDRKQAKRKKSHHVTNTLDKSTNNADSTMARARHDDTIVHCSNKQLKLSYQDSPINVENPLEAPDSLQWRGSKKTFDD